jgi:hypothetical protein
MEHDAINRVFGGVNMAQEGILLVDVFPGTVRPPPDSLHGHEGHPVQGRKISDSVASTALFGSKKSHKMKTLLFVMIIVYLVSDYVSPLILFYIYLSDFMVNTKYSSKVDFNTITP